MNVFRRAGSGIEVALEDSEASILARLGPLLSAAGVTKSDPARSRLNPTIYPDDDIASREFERLAEKERVEARSADRERFANTLRDATTGPTVLSYDDAAAWARVLGEARVVLAARHGLFESGLPDELPTDPEVVMVLLLGHLQEELVGQMLATMEETT